MKRGLRPYLREITDVYVPIEHRKQGWARALMEAIVLEADEACVGLILSVREHGDMPDEALQRFYASLGFEVFQDRPRLMMRAPNRLATEVRPQTEALH